MSTPSALGRSSTQPSVVEGHHTEEALADIVQAIAYLNEGNPTAAAKLDADITRCIERLADREFDGPVARLRSGAVVRSWAVPPFRIYYQRHPDEIANRAGLPSGAATHYPLVEAAISVQESHPGFWG